MVDSAAAFQFQLVFAFVGANSCSADSASKQAAVSGYTPACHAEEPAVCIEAGTC